MRAYRAFLFMKRVVSLRSPRVNRERVQTACIADLKRMKFGLPAVRTPFDEVRILISCSRRSGSGLIMIATSSLIHF